MAEEKKKIDPLEYFANIKEAKKKTNDKFLKALYENTEILLKKAHTLGQDTAINKLLFAIDVIEKEKVLLNLGIDTFVYKEDVEEFLADVDDKVIKIIELKKYPREIPDEIASKIVELKEKKIFDEYFVVFTDYTGEVEKLVAQENRRKDPIIFGVFKKDRNLHDRFYYLADWEDEYCDLTLDKMVSHMSENGKTIIREVSSGNSIEDIKKYVAKLEEDRNTFRIRENPSIFKKVKMWLSKK